MTALLDLELETLWLTDERGRMERVRTPTVRPAPLLVAAIGAAGEAGNGLTWRCSTAVPDDTAAAIGEILAGESPDPSPAVGWQPVVAEGLLALLAAVAHVGEIERGPSYVVEGVPPVGEGIECWAGTDADVDRLAGLMPEEDRVCLGEPWAVALSGGQVGAVCETARSAPASVEAGVWTYDDYRRQGLASAATATWTSLVAGRTVFYSTSFDNLGSQGVARRLGLRPIGHWWEVIAA